MEGNVKSSLKFVDYCVDYIKFQNNPRFNSTEVKIDCDFTPEFDFADSNKNMIVKLNAEVFKNAQENNYPFEMEVSIIGFFELNGDVDENIKKYETNALAILFPYIRSLITSFTANSNVMPLIIPAININKLIESKRNDKKQI